MIDLNECPFLHVASKTMTVTNGRRCGVTVNNYRMIPQRKPRRWALGNIVIYSRVIMQPYHYITVSSIKLTVYIHSAVLALQTPCEDIRLHNYSYGNSKAAREDRSTCFTSQPHKRRQAAKTRPVIIISFFRTAFDWLLSPSIFFYLCSI